MTFPEWLGTTLSVLLGGAITIVTTFITGSQASKREREARSYEQKQVRNLKFEEFQRENLLELQDLSQQLGRMFAQIHFHDVTEYRKGSEFGKTNQPEELNSTTQVTQAKIRVISSRIKDSQVRELSNKFSSHLSSIALAQSERESIDLLKSAMNAHQELLEKTGSIIRSIDDA